MAEQSEGIPAPNKKPRTKAEQIRAIIAKLQENVPADNNPAETTDGDLEQFLKTKPVADK